MAQTIYEDYCHKRGMPHDALTIAAQKRINDMNEALPADPTAEQLAAYHTGRFALYEEVGRSLCGARANLTRSFGVGSCASAFTLT
jgi:hypothetical protein